MEQRAQSFNYPSHEGTQRDQDRGRDASLASRTSPFASSGCVNENYQSDHILISHLH